MAGRRTTIRWFVCLLFVIFIFGTSQFIGGKIKVSLHSYKKSEDGYMGKAFKMLETVKHYTPHNIDTKRERKSSAENHYINDIDENIKQKFEQIAMGHKWGGGNETVSGPGSLLSSTLTLRECLGNWIKKYNIRSVVDIPCGDANWQHAIPGIETIFYRGYDVSKTAINRAKQKNPWWSFELLDITRSVPPRADLIILRDFIQHLPLDMGKEAIVNAFLSNATWLGITTHINATFNKNIQIGGYYRNNVLKKPFNLHKPTEICNNYFRRQPRDSMFYFVRMKDLDLLRTAD